MNHYEFAGRIDENHLATNAEEHEHAPLSRKDPDLITVAVGPQERTGTGQVRLALGARRVASSIQAAGMICRPRQLPS